MEEQKKEYKWYLKYFGRKDTPSFRAAIKHLDTFPLWKDSEAKVITFNEYNEMVTQGNIAPPQSYWNVSEGQVGVVILSYYLQYSETWSKNIDPAFQDFQDGWRACEENLYELPSYKVKESKKEGKKNGTHHTSKTDVREAASL